MISIPLVTFFLLTACNKTNEIGRPQIPDKTEGSFNFLNDNGKGGLIVFDQKGNKVSPESKPIPPDAKLTLERTIKFYKVNPCYAEVCSGAGVCVVYKISNGPCPPGF